MTTPPMPVAQPYCKREPDNLSVCLRGPDVVNSWSFTFIYYVNRTKVYTKYDAKNTYKIHITRCEYSSQ